MRVLQVHERYRDGDSSGENRVVDAEAEQLALAGHEVVRTGYDNLELDRLPRHRRAVLPLQLVWSPGALARLRAEIRRVRPDVVHVHNLFPVLSPSILTVGREVPLVGTLHNYRLLCAAQTLVRDGERCSLCVGHRIGLAGVAHKCFEGSRLRSVPMALHIAVAAPRWRRHPVTLIALSPAHRAQIVAGGFHPDQVVVKGNGVADEALAPRPDRRTIAFLGRLAEPKGIVMLMQAWDRVAVAAESAGVTLTIAGAGPLGDEVAAWAGRTPAVRVAGMLDRAACWELLSEARAVAVPSRWAEPFGLAAVEAMCASTVPIVPDDGSFPDLVRDGVDGLVYRQGDVGALAARLTEVIAAPLDQMGQAARATYESRFTPAANLAALEAIYDEAVRRYETRRSPSGRA